MVFLALVPPRPALVPRLQRTTALLIAAFNGRPRTEADKALSEWRATQSRQQGTLAVSFAFCKIRCLRVKLLHHTYDTHALTRKLPHPGASVFVGSHFFFVKFKVIMQPAGQQRRNRAKRKSVT
jgi:hypothetical protein